MGTRCEHCAARLGPDLATALRLKIGQLRRFGLADAAGFILEPMIGPDGWDRLDPRGFERGEGKPGRRER